VSWNILTWCSNSRYLYDSRQLASSLLPDQSDLSVSYYNIDKFELSNMNFFCELTILIPWLPCLFNKANAVSSTVVLDESETSDSVNSFNFAMCTFASNCFHMEQVPWFDGWRRTWWQMLLMIRALLVSLILQCIHNHHEGAYLESFHSIECSEPTFIEAHQVSNKNCKVGSLNHE